MIPKLILSDAAGNIFVHPTYCMAGCNGRDLCQLSTSELQALPSGSTLFYLPGHAAIGWDEGGEEFVSLEKLHGRRVFPVSAFVIPGFTRTYLPAAKKINPKTTLPLWPYTAVGWADGKFVAATVRIDPSIKQNPSFYKQRSLLEKNITTTFKKFPTNRLFKHLSHCALSYNCRNAQNLFLNRWEAPLPISPLCNARCLGCLSKQEPKSAPASHERISFVPTPLEVAQVAVSHLKNCREGIVSFGQGCEGEPLLEFSVLKESIRLIRRQTPRGTIHLNTNGFYPRYIKELATSGLDSVRVSINSLDKKLYEAYFRPRGYDLSDVLRSVVVAKKSGLFVSLNLLTFPGITDSSCEVFRLIKFLNKGFVDLLQLRNLSIDPDFFLKHMPVSEDGSLGILNMVTLLKRSCPKVRLGYFNLPKERFK